MEVEKGKRNRGWRVGKKEEKKKKKSTTFYRTVNHASLLRGGKINNV